MHVRRRIEARFSETGSPAQVPMARGGSFQATLVPEGVEVDNLGQKPSLPWAVFEETVALLEELGGSARHGNAMGSRLGNPDLGFDTIEGRIASKVYGRLKGDSVFRRSTPVAGILVWAGICERLRGGLSLADGSPEPASPECDTGSSGYKTAAADDDLSAYMELYEYAPKLTASLDALADTPFDQATINEIVLWKLNRYAASLPICHR